jgi:thymidylate kinase
MTKKGKLVILVGIDGSGKSTIASYLEKKGYFVSYWRKLKSFSLPKPLNFDNPAEVVQSLRGQERLDFILAYVNSEWEYLVKPTLNIGMNVISDGFFIRFFIKEKIYKKLVIEKFLAQSLLKGDELIIMIDTPVEIAFKRKSKSKISPYECFKNPQDFIYFQRIQRKLLLEFIKNFPHVIIDGRLLKAKIAKEVLIKLKENHLEPN